MNKILSIDIIMTKTDLKDRKILYELDIDCRQSNAQIGKKVGLGRDVVSYRINKMEEEGLIKNYYAVINTFRLGYNVFRMYINFQYVNQEIKDQIIKYFVEYKNSWVVHSIKSEIDLNVVIWVKDIYEFYQFLDTTLDRFEDYFEKYTISIYILSDVYKKSYLLPENNDKSNRIICRMDCGQKPVEIDETDYKILNELAVDARAPLIELAEKFGISSQSVNYRIKNLVKNGVIDALRVNLNLSKLGLQSFKVDIHLKDHKFKKQIIDYLKTKPYTEFMNIAIGWSDLEPEFVVKNLEELIKIMGEIGSEFPGAIKKQSFFIIEKTHKIQCMPAVFD